MAEWITPVFDRTQGDIDYATNQIEHWKKTGNFDNWHKLKGCLDASDLNRIENNTQYLKDILSKLYYFSNVSCRTWEMADLPTSNDSGRICINVLSVGVAYGHPDGFVFSIVPLTTYENLNTIEKNLYLVKELLDELQASMRECGTFECGEVE